MKHIITFETGNKYEIDEGATETTMRSYCGRFFNVKFGSRETFTVYRGFVITRHTETFSDRIPRRLTVVYAFLMNLEGRPDMLCVSGIGGGNNVKTVRQAKRLIDRIIAEKRCAYDMDAVVA